MSNGFNLGVIAHMGFTGTEALAQRRQPGWQKPGKRLVLRKVCVKNYPIYVKPVEYYIKSCYNFNNLNR